MIKINSNITPSVKVTVSYEDGEFTQEINFRLVDLLHLYNSMLRLRSEDWESIDEIQYILRVLKQQGVDCEQNCCKELNIEFNQYLIEELKNSDYELDDGIDLVENQEEDFW